MVPVVTRKPIPVISCRIYKLFSPHMKQVYIGSTDLTLNRRLQIHTGKHTAYLLDKPHSSYCSSYEILEASDYDIELIEEFTYYDGDTITRTIKEAYYINANDCVNKFLCTKGVDDKTLKSREYSARYGATHRAEKNAYNAKYRADHKSK